MGIEMRARNVRWGAETDADIAFLIERLSPMLRGNADTIRWALGFTRTVLSTPGIVEQLAAALQDASCVFFVRNGGAAPASLDSGKQIGFRHKIEGELAQRRDFVARRTLLRINLLEERKRA